MDESQKVSENDHKRIGKELDLFVFSDLVGPGLPLWTPRGTVLREELDRFVQEMRKEYGYQAVVIPHITKKDLYQKSGHWEKFSDELFKIVSREKHEFALKPMNCPHHTQIYASKPRSYRELPIRYRETTTCYRDEQTGELNGILRPRAFTQDDAHVFCRKEHIVDEILKIWDIIERFYGALDFPLRLRISTRDPKTPEAYAGSEDKWNQAEAELRKVVEQHKHKIEVEDGAGEASFYAPKLDFMSKDSLGREWQVATIQLDVAQPEGLGLTYVNEDGAEEVPFLIHAAIMGSLERFLAIYIEHCGGRFPVWLAPEQLRVVTINDDENTLKLANNIVEKATKLNLRANLDSSNESVGKKIANAEHMKVPYVVVIGPKEAESGQVEPRSRSDLDDVKAMPIEDFLKQIAEQTQNRSA